jgi:hypothetical protein
MRIRLSTATVSPTNAMPPQTDGRLPGLAGINEPLNWCSGRRIRSREVRDPVRETLRELSHARDAALDLGVDHVAP